MQKCLNCQGKNIKEGFLANEKGILYVTEGDPKSIKKQLFGKRKALRTKVCNDCGYTMTFVR